ncbi:fused response regulator/phosphatase [Mucilaginibacter robiniae]|uniref:Fused response regulator/phosphatase n=1 Tax=Mucilaginibacter robiniae TaxID=2728022 RepID=A0A7L5DU41_9SPHI|nr:fused response regulator/phosphatase [Mucilaginibacter robiniae]QJD94572.1 fused response regulator/phosphatase [Mucilaginibacter robiniae]
MTASAPKNILLVDDNVLFLKLLKQAFRQAGLECHTAPSAQEALQWLKSNTPDAILSDYEMPGMNGLQFRRHLLKQSSLSDIPFIFLTAVTDTQLMTAGLSLQAVDYVVKNTPVPVIVAKLTNLLNTVDKQRQLSEQEIKKTAAALNIKAVPDNVPPSTDFAINFWHQDYQDIPGGDFIDFIEADERYLFIVLGDIMGKKWKAWFFTFSYLSYIRAAIRFGIMSQELSTAVILQKVNQIICYDQVLKDILSSLSLVRLDRQTGQLTYAGAGDLPLLHYHYDEGKYSQIQSSGLLLGLFPDGMYQETEIRLAEHDSLLLFTDGLIDYDTGDGSKSDYTHFANRITELLSTQSAFGNVKDDLLRQSDLWVDDASLIHIQKN